MSMSTAELADILRRREIKSVYYFHADHFEPWSLGLNEQTARGVDRMREMSAASPFGSKMSLFYCPFVPYNVDLSEGRSAKGQRVDGDAVVFGARSADQEKLARDAIRPLVMEDRHEMHLHVHHEFWTRNDSNFESPVSRWVNANSTAEMDERRLDLGFRLFKESVSKDMGEPFERWAFVHGNWALAGSDPLICKLENELSMIMRHGGFGDFSFPAGRGYCDPRLPAPFTCLPIDVKRAYDDPASEPRLIGHDALKPDRFFIWNSPIRANFSSLDYYSESNRDLFRDTARMVSEWLTGSVSFGSDLFIKTHAHSMKWEYEIFKPDSRIPHCYPDVVAIFEELRRACDVAGVEFRPVTVNEVMTLLHAHDAVRLSDTSVGAAALEAQPCSVGGVAHHHAEPHHAEVVPPPEKRPPASGADKAAGVAAEPPSHSVAPEPAASPEASTAFDRVAPLERELASIVSKWVRSDPRGIESAGEFYLNLIDRDHILHDYERAVFDYATANFLPESTRIVEVGVGYGILSILLAATGYEVIAFEGSPLRMAGLQFLVDAVAERVPGLRSRLRPICGWFPDALDPAMLEGERRNVFVTTNVVSSATDERTGIILAAAGKFDDLVIDTTRFGVSRYDAAEEQFRKTISGVCQPVSSVWRQEPNEILHFRPTPAARQVATATATVADGVEKAPAGSFLRGSPVKDLATFSSELLSLQGDWSAGDGAAYQADELYVAKLKRGVTLEAYELAVADAIAERFERDTMIVEIGTGYGALALLLAQAGFMVHGFDGDRRRGAACSWHIRQYLERYPHLAGRIAFTSGFFPDRLPAGFGLGHGKRVGIATNITNTYTATNQDALLYAARDFDEFIIDLARFGKSRNTQAERDALRELMAKSHFEPVERLYFSEPYEYWRFRIKPASRISVIGSVFLPDVESRAKAATVIER